MTSLLPPNATRFQRHLEIADDFLLDIEEAVYNLQTLKSDPQEHLLYWLIWEYGLDELLPFFVDPQKLLFEGRKWQQLLGAPQSVKIALSWLGFAPIEIEEESEGRVFFQYQIKLDRLPEAGEIGKIQQLAQLSAPLRTRLCRIFNEDYDVRRFILSDSTFGNYLSDYSGTHYQGIRLSLGRKHQGLISYEGGQVEGGAVRKRHFNVDLWGQLVRLWDKSKGIEHSFVHIFNSKLTTLVLCSPSNRPLFMQTEQWMGKWASRSWETQNTSSPKFIHKQE